MNRLFFVAMLAAVVSGCCVKYQYESVTESDRYVIQADPSTRYRLEFENGSDSRFMGERIEVLQAYLYRAHPDIFAADGGDVVKVSFTQFAQSQDTSCLFNLIGILSLGIVMPTDVDWRQGWSFTVKFGGRTAMDLVYCIQRDCGSFIVPTSCLTYYRDISKNRSDKVGARDFTVLARERGITYSWHDDANGKNFAAIVLNTMGKALK